MSKLKWLTVVLTLFFLNISPSIEQLSKKITSGFYPEEIPSVNFYKAVVPLVFEFKVPIWLRNYTQILGSQNCTDNTFTSSSTCPVLFYLPAVHEIFAEYLTDTQPLSLTFESEPHSDPIDFVCDIIEPHFKGLYTTKESMEDYLSRLKQCATNEFLYLRNIPSYMYNISEVYANMRQGFYTEFWMKINDGRIDPAVWTNGVNSLNALHYINFFMESNRWKFAMGDCSAGKIPSTLITASLLNDALNEVEDKLAKKNYFPSIPFKKIGQYFSTQLTDCTFTNDTYVVRILFPVVPDHMHFKLMKFTPSSFTMVQNGNNYLCTLNSGKKNFLVDTVNKIAYENTMCTQRNGLCKIPSASQPGHISICATAILNSNTEDIVRMCDIRCDKVSTFQTFPIIQKVTPNTFIVTGYSPLTMVLRCVREKDVVINTVEIGAIEIKLESCLCRLLHGSEIFQAEANSCVDQKITQGARVKHIVPYHWIPIDRLKVLENNLSTDFSFRTNNLIYRGVRTNNNEKRVDLNYQQECQYGSCNEGIVTAIVFLFFTVVPALGCIAYLFRKVDQMSRTAQFGCSEVSYKSSRLLENEERHCPIETN